jgi:hypothetical protein
VGNAADSRSREFSLFGFSFPSEGRAEAQHHEKTRERV